MVCKQTIAAVRGHWGSRRLRSKRGGGGDNRDRTDDPLLAKQVLSQLSYAPKLDLTCHNRITRSPPAGLKHHRSRKIALVGQGGFEPPTPRLSSVCSNQLSY